MVPFKHFYKQQQLVEENRRTFLKTLFGTAAAAAVSNPVAITNTVAKQAGLPWIKLTVSNEFMIDDYKDVSPVDMAEIIKGKSGFYGDKYTPGVSKDGSVVIDYNDSATDAMEIYVKPGTDTYDKTRMRIDGNEPEVEAGGAYDFEKQVFDTIGSGDGSGPDWFENQIERDQEDELSGYEGQPEDWKDEIATVDGLEPGNYDALSHKNAADKAKYYIDQAGDIGAEVPDWMRDTVARSYMKSHVLANGGGSEEISMDSMAELQELYPDDDIETPDEMDVDRWLEGEADNPMDTMGAYDSDRYQQDMDQVQGTGDEDQDDIEDWITAGFNFLMGASQKQEQVPVKHLSNVPNFYDAIKKGRAINGSKFNMSGEPDMNEPLQISHDGREPIEIIGGFEQLAAADEDKIAVPRVQMIHVDELQTEPESTSKYLDNENI